MPRFRTRLALAIGLWALAGCGHIAPPYARGQAPEPTQLLPHTGAQLHALQVSKAKVIANRTVRGNLAFIAEAPSRFRGTVEIAGNELVTLAFHEQGYALRYKMDAFPSGFYSGPPSGCAVEALLGVSFDTKGLVDLVLGGAPVIEGPHEVLEQKWDRRKGFERLVIANDRFVQELRFGWVAGDWRVVGGQLWERSGKERGRRLWTVEHLDLEAVDGAFLPTKTKVSTPGKRRDDTVVINYKERDPDPAFAKREGGDGGDDGGDSGDPWEDDGGWEDDDGWEDDGAPDAGEGEGEDDGGGDDEGTPSEAEGTPPDGTPVEGEGTPPEAEAAPKPKPKPTKPEPTKPKPTKPKPAPAPPRIPPEFLLEPTGLVERGDLCR